MKPRRIVPLVNYSEHEGECKCGCGLPISDEAAICLQAFIYVLERHYGCRVRHVTKEGEIYGSRCPKHNADEKGAKDSRHIHADAADGYFERLYNGKWAQIPNSEIFTLAKQSGLFGGIGYMKYVKAKKNLVHLDTRPGPLVTW